VEAALGSFRSAAARFDLVPIEEGWAHHGPPGDQVHGVGLRDATFRSPWWGHCSGSSVATTFDPAGCLVGAYGEMLESVSCDFWYPDWLPSLPEITPVWDEQEVSAERCAPTLPAASGVRRCVEACAATAELRVHPYRSVADPAEVILFPRELGLEVCGRNNGAGVGTEPAEAIVTGLLEIFERYAVEKFALGTEGFPRIDPQVFASTRAGRIAEHLRGEGCETHYVDMSLGGRLPVVGVLLVRPAEGAMSIAVAGSHSLHGAVEHCLREMLSDEFYRDPLVGWPPGASGDDAARAWSRSGFTLGWGGRLDHVDFAGAYSDVFRGAFVEGIADNHELLRRCIGVSRTFGAEVHARDCSILGVPSFHVYAGVLSDNMFVAHEGVMSAARNAELLVAVSRDRWRRDYLPLLARCREGDLEGWTVLRGLLDNPFVGFPDDEDVCDYFNWPVTSPEGSPALASDRRGVALTTLVAGLAYHAGDFSSAAALWRRPKAIRPVHHALVGHYLDLAVRTSSVSAARATFEGAMGPVRLADVERELAVESLIRIPLRPGAPEVSTVEERWRRFRSKIYPARGAWRAEPFALRAI